MDPSGLHSGREPPVSQRPITYGKDIARVTGKDFYRRPKRLLRKLNSNHRIVERSVYVRDARRDVLLFALTHGFLLGHGSFLFLLAGDGARWTFARSRICVRALATHRQTAPMA